MKRYEYIRLAVDFGDLSELNRLSGIGWHVVAVVQDEHANWMLLERELPALRAGGGKQASVSPDGRK